PGGMLIATPRLRHRHLVLRRACWELDSGAVRELCTQLAAGGEVPVVSRWRARLGLPEQVFLRAAAPPVVDRAAQGFVAYLWRPKPHLVDLGNALHLRCLGRWLARPPDGVVFEEALPAPGGRDHPYRAIELVVETYRSGRRAWT